ncbi:MAG: flagellar biosynthesis protein FlgD [Sideroxydans sp.]|nr:flagellar biosynthesis protein FlgD [Sideroxydans sp.]
MVTATNTNPASSLISSLNASNSSLGASSAASANSSTALQNRFMTLLVTQLQNQDPLNPMDNSQMTSQLAQLSTVEGVNQLNTTLQALSNSMIASSSSSMIGHGVLVQGSAINLSGGQALGGVQLQNPADNVIVKIQDTAGNVVRTMRLGAQQAGIVPLTWDGKNDAGTTVADGSYTFSAQSVNGTDTAAATTLSFGTVNAVTPTSQGASLNVAQLGAFDMSKILMVM